MVEGVRAVRELLRAANPIQFCVVTRLLQERPGGVALLQALLAGDAPVLTVEPQQLAELSDTEAPQGVLAVASVLSPGPDVLAAARGVLVLDAVQDPGNVGTLIRSAHAFGLGGVIALTGTADPWSAKAIRASAGSVFHVPTIRGQAVAGAPWLASPGGERRIWAADVRGRSPRSVESSALDGGWALVVGNEGAGVSQAVTDLVAPDSRLALPMPGGAESLNAAIAGSILMYELMNRMSEELR